VEYRDRYGTNRALPDPRAQLPANSTLTVSQPNTHWGDSYERDIMSLANLNLPITEDGKQIVYTADPQGYGQVSIVDVPEWDSLPDRSAVR